MLFGTWPPNDSNGRGSFPPAKWPPDAPLPSVKTAKGDVCCSKEALSSHALYPFPLSLSLACNLPSVLQHRVQSAHPHPVAPLVLARIQVQNKTQSAVEFLKDNATACHVHVQPAVAPSQGGVGEGVWHMQQHVDCTSFDSQLTVIKDYLGHCQAP